MISYFQFQDYAFQNSEDAYNTELAYGQAHPEVMGAFKDYNTFGDVDADRSGEAQLNFRDNLTFATIAKDVAVQRIHEIQDTFRCVPNVWCFPTFKRNINEPVQVPNVTPDSIWDTRYILAIKDDPRIQALSATSSTRPVLTNYAPPATGTTIMGFYAPSSFAFQNGSATFVAPFGAQDQMNAGVVPILKLTPFNFNITYASDGLAQLRMQAIKEMLRNLGVPDNRVTTTQDPAASAGTLSYTLVGDPQ